MKSQRIIKVLTVHPEGNMNEPHFITIHPTADERFQSGLKMLNCWWCWIKSQWITRVMRIHSLWIMNLSTIVISLWIKGMDPPTLSSLKATPLVLLKIALYKLNKNALLFHCGFAGPSLTTSEEFPCKDVWTDYGLRFRRFPSCFSSPEDI